MSWKDEYLAAQQEDAEEAQAQEGDQDTSAFAMLDESAGELEAWQRTVDDYAGLRKPGTLSLWQELMRSQLSGRHIEPTKSPPVGLFGGVGNFDRFALCEMRLSMPMHIDVTVSVPNIQNVDIAASGIFVTWGSTKGVVNEAEIDVGRGWRHPFYASYLRVEYIAIRGGDTAIVMPGNQPEDAVFTASISPASGAPAMPLTCTRFFGLGISANGGVAVRDIPAFARYFTLGGGPGGNFPDILFESTIQQGNASGVTLWRQQFNLDTGGSPSYLSNQTRYPVVQRASNLRWQNFAINPLDNPVAMFELQL